MTFQNKKILVAGLGGTGISMIAYLRKNGAEVAAYDEELKAERVSQIGKMFDGLVFYTGRLKDALDNGFDILALSPGISERQPDIEAFKQNGGRVLGDIELLADIVNRRSDKVIAITGSNGKTTVTSLVGYPLHQVRAGYRHRGQYRYAGFGGGIAARRQKGGRVGVGAFQLQLENTESLRPTAATVLNISEDHLDRYDDLLDYAHTKDKIFRGDGVQVLNSDDVFCRAMKRAGREVKWFSLEHEADFWLERETGRLKQGNEDLIATQDIPLQGLHNAANVMAAVALCEAVGLPREALLEHVKTFQGLPHRVEKIGEKNGVVFIDDSKGTNVGATAAAIAGLQNPLFVILGGMGKGQDFTPLRDALAGKAKGVFLIGVDAPQIRRDLDGCGLNMTDCATLEEARSDGIRPSRSGRYCVAQPCLCEL